MMDATMLPVPRQHDTREENEKIKKGEVPEAWKDNPRKLAHKDMDAACTQKGGERFFGYKDHVKTGEVTKLIHDYRETSASVHDVKPAPEMIRKADEALHADGAYIGPPMAGKLKEEGHIHERGSGGQPLTGKQMECNRIKSKIRTRMKHPFAFIEKSLGAFIIVCRGNTQPASNRNDESRFPAHP